MPSANSLTDQVRAFLTCCDDIHHLNSVMAWVNTLSNNPIESSMKIFKKMGGAPELWGAGTCTTVTHLFKHGDVLPYSAAYGGKWTKGQGIGKFRTEMDSRNCSLNLTIVYEAWEKFVKSILPIILFEARKGHSLKAGSVERFLKRYPAFLGQEDTLDYFVNFVKFICLQDCTEAYGYLKRVLEFDAKVKLIRCPGLKMCWFEVVKLITFCRNHIVHGDGRVSTDRLSRLGPVLARWVEERIAESIITSERRLFLKMNDFESLVRALTSLAYGIYLLAIEKFDFEQDFDLFSGLK